MESLAVESLMLETGSSPSPTRRRETSARPRYAIYVPIHKALRALMVDVLIECGRLGADDDASQQTLGHVRTLLELCRHHLDAEQRFIHPAMEARAPGSAQATERDHAGHLVAFDRIAHRVARVERAHGEARASAALALYRELSLFIAENFVHMNEEETKNQAVLEACYTDAELEAIAGAIVASIPAPTLAVFKAWIDRATA